MTNTIYFSTFVYLAVSNVLPTLNVNWEYYWRYKKGTGDIKQFNARLCKNNIVTDAAKYLIWLVLGSDIKIVNKVNIFGDGETNLILLDTEVIDRQ